VEQFKGFLQVRENWKKIQVIYVVRERSGKNIIFEKSEEMILDHADCRYLIFFVSSNIKKQANLQLPLNVQKLEVFRLQGAFASCPRTRVFVVFCHLHIAPLIWFHNFMI